MRLPGDAETDMCVAWARSKGARRLAMTTWAPSGQHRGARGGEDALLTSKPADLRQQFTQKHSDRPSAPPTVSAPPHLLADWGVSCESKAANEQ